MGRSSIVRKLLSINLLVSVSALLLAGVLWVEVALSIYQNYFDQRITNQARLVASNSSAAILFEDWEEVEVILSALKTDPAIVEARVSVDGLDEPFVLRLQEIPEQQRVADRMFRSLRVRSGSVAVPVVANAQQIGEVELSYHSNEIYDAFVDIVTSLVAIALPALLLGGVVLLRMQAMVTAPLRELSTLARRVTESKNYSLRGSVSSRDEVGALAEDFNSMLDIVEARDQDLEGEVQKRTRELEEKNRELEHEISERVRAEGEKREVEARFEQAFINAPIGMALVDRNRKVLRCNDALRRTLDMQVDEELHLRDFIDEAGFRSIDRNFQALVDGVQAAFEVDADCHDRRGRSMSAILSFSAVDSADDQLRYTVLQFQDVTESKKLSEELEFQASHDVLTSLPNRRMLKDALTAASEGSPFRRFALGILDLDRFKIVNDACGHPAGDELLRQVAELIRQAVRPGDLVARLGGDEFAILLRDCSTTQVESITEAIREAIEQWEFSYDGTVFRVGVSVGIVIVHRPTIESSELMKQADAACFVAKDLGRNRVHIVDEENREAGKVQEWQGEMRWVQRILEAIDGNKFVLYRQPVAPLCSDSTVERHEILLRLWDDKQQQIIPPGAFIPAAERYGLMAKVDRWVVDRLISVLTENPELRDQGQSYWVNLSGLSLGDDKFMAHLEAALSAAGLPEGTINFEVTETAVMSNITDAMQFMSSVRSTGCRFALDDFGSGMSSFGYLKNLPVDYIKIDGMFVRDILTDEIDLIFVKSMIDIAKVMGVKSIAEYVESEAIRETVKQLGADYGQGFAIGRPAPLLDQDHCEPSEASARADVDAGSRLANSRDSA